MKIKTKGVFEYMNIDILSSYKASYTYYQNSRNLLYSVERRPLMAHI